MFAHARSINKSIISYDIINVFSNEIKIIKEGDQLFCLYTMFII